MSSQASKRNSNIELLRIIMILLIIAHHYVVNSGLTDLYDYNHVSMRMAFFQLFGMWGKTVINVFTLITGYFMIKSNISVRKILKLYIIIKFWQFVFYVGFLISGYETFSAKGLIKTVFSIEFEFNELYCGTLIALVLFIPFINILLKKITRHQYKLLLAYIVFWQVICTTFFLKSTSFLSWLIACYAIGAYLGKYNVKWDNIICGILGSIISILLMSASVIIVDFLDEHFRWLDGQLIAPSNRALAVSTALFIFILFKNIKMKNIAIINILASATFGVLVIHTCSDTMRRFLWKTVFNNVGHYNDKYAILYAIGVVLIVYFTCAFLELARIYLLDKPFFAWIDKKGWSSRIERKIDFNREERG